MVAFASSLKRIHQVYAAPKLTRCTMCHTSITQARCLFVVPTFRDGLSTIDTWNTNPTVRVAAPIIKGSFFHSSPQTQKTPRHTISGTSRGLSILLRISNVSYTDFYILYYCIYRNFYFVFVAISATVVFGGTSISPQSMWSLPNLPWIELSWTTVLDVSPALATDAMRRAICDSVHTCTLSMLSMSLCRSLMLMSALCNMKRTQSSKHATYCYFVKFAKHF